MRSDRMRNCRVQSRRDEECGHARHGATQHDDGGQALTAAFAFAPTDRLLVLAPHPDDESIATGGLLQVARACDVAIRVIVLTDGDNNPWPQRWIEKRWHIGADERRRWGARRREEAQVAMRILGMDDGQMCFFGLPDLGLTDLLMRASPGPIDRLRAELDEFAPTVLVLPAPSDRHPDHSAAHVLARLALARCSAGTPQLFGFAVHGEASVSRDLTIELSAEQRDVKRAAIRAHVSQMRLSERRFVRYARPQESYRRLPGRPQPDPQNPLSARVDAQGRVQVRIDPVRRPGGVRKMQLSFVLEGGACGSRRLCMPMGAADGELPLFDCVAGEHVGTAHVHRIDGALTVKLPVDLGRPDSGFVKLARPQPGLWVLDRCGWQTLAVQNDGDAAAIRLAPSTDAKIST